jgi:hypothetical protein
VSRHTLLAVVLALMAVPLRARAQGTSDELLTQAKGLYARLEIERAVPILRQLVSPGWPFEFSTHQRVEAYTYLGAALALSGRPDSALVYFRAALEWDPFTDLDAARFTPEQVRLFADARRLTFSLGLRPPAVMRVDPRIDRARFTIVTTHKARVEMSLRPADSMPPALLYGGEVDGLREVAWDGLLNSVRAPPGIYELVVSAASARSGRKDSARVFLEIRHEVEPLEDTIPELGPNELLPERHPRSAAARELLKGLGIAAGALLISQGLQNESLGIGKNAGTLFVGVAVTTGVGAYVWRRRHPEIAANVTENVRRMAERRAANDAIRSRNAERLGRTVLVITPAAGLAK